MATRGGIGQVGGPIGGTGPPRNGGPPTRGVPSHFEGGLQGAASGGSSAAICPVGEHLDRNLRCAPGLPTRLPPPPRQRSLEEVEDAARGLAEFAIADQFNRGSL